jgi:hypothetical protein
MSTIRTGGIEDFEPGRLRLFNSSVRIANVSG